MCFILLQTLIFKGIDFTTDEAKSTRTENNNDIIIINNNNNNNKRDIGFRLMWPSQRAELTARRIIVISWSALKMRDCTIQFTHPLQANWPTHSYKRRLKISESVYINYIWTWYYGEYIFIGYFWLTRKNTIDNILVSWALVNSPHPFLYKDNDCWPHRLEGGLSTIICI